MPHSDEEMSRLAARERAAGPATVDRAETETSIAARFEEMAGRHAARPAVTSQGRSISYAELNGMANGVAAAVIERGANDAPVAVLLDKDWLGAAAVIGALKAGRVYVPLEAGYPGERIRFILADSGAGLLLAPRRHVEQARAAAGDVPVLALEDLVAKDGTANPGAAIAPDANAVILYTSGSTGTPKGVVDTHRNFIYEMIVRGALFRLTPEDRISSPESFAFSASLRHFWPAVLSGACACLVEPAKISGEGLIRWLTSERCTIVGHRESLKRITAAATPSDDFESVRALSAGGDTIYRRDVEGWLEVLRPEMFQASFASTEAGAITAYPMTDVGAWHGEIMPVGYPVADKEVRVVDDGGNVVPRGEAGEIVVVSRYMAAGYWRRPELTAAKYREVPGEPEKRMFLTGDVGRMMPDGCLVHLGRKDYQVKVRGFRVEMPEVEAALLRAPGVKDAAVAVRNDRHGQKILVGYVVARAGEAPTVSALRAHLAARLPEFAVPGRYVFLDKFPMTVTDKIDRKALPDPPALRPPLDTPFVAPGSPIEEAVAAIWVEVLGINPVGVDDNFFELGGDSITAARLASRVREALSDRAWTCRGSSQGRRSRARRRRSRRRCWRVRGRRRWTGCWRMSRASEAGRRHLTQSRGDAEKG